MMTRFGAEGLLRSPERRIGPLCAWPPGFQVLHQEDALAVVARDAAKAYIVASPAYAAKDRPEITIETDTICRAVPRDCC